MKLKAALKKFDFVKRLKLPEELWPKVIANLVVVSKGAKNKYVTPIGKKFDPIELLVDWEILYEQHEHKLNAPLREIEMQQQDKFGTRSEAAPWIERKPGLIASYQSQTDNFNPNFYHFDDGEADLAPLSKAETMLKVKHNTNSGMPFLTNKGKALRRTLDEYDELLDRKDPCVLFTRTSENGKTRNVWGYPFADIFYEMSFFVPFLNHMRKKWWQASVISPEEVDRRLTVMIKEAISSDRILYSVDFNAFDASCAWQTIVKAFDYIKRCFDPDFGEFLDEICVRFYTISIITPTGVLRGKHGVPSGSCFTNLIDSLIQAGTALTLDFINECEMMINGDDGVYMMHRENITQFEDNWKQARLNLGKDKVKIAPDWCTYCQRFYHIDYIKDDHIGGIYPLFRALNRLVWLENFVDLRKMRISSRDHFGIRTLTILEQCKYHPLFEIFVRFILEREKYALDVTEEGLASYTNSIRKGRYTPEEELNAPDGVNYAGIRNFESYKLVQKIIETEGYFDVVDLEALEGPLDEVYTLED